MDIDRRHGLLLIELPGTFLSNLVCNHLDPGLRLSLRETCKSLCTLVDTYSHPHCRLGGANTLADRFLVLSRVSDGTEELDVSCCDADLSPAAADAALPPGSWQKLTRLVCHCKQMILVNTLVKCAPTQLTSIGISARKGNWQHAGLLLQQLHGLPCLRTLELALPAQHKLDELLAGLTQIKSLKLTAAPRTGHGGNWPLIPLLGMSNKLAKVDAAFWHAAICPLTQLTSLQLSLPLVDVGLMQLQPLWQLRQLQCCCARDMLPHLLEQLTVLQALTSLCVDAKVGRRISPMALAQRNIWSPDLRPLGQLPALVELQLNIHQVIDIAALLPLCGCKQLKVLGVSRLQLQLPWRRTELTPALVAAADNAEAMLLTAVVAGQLDVPVAQVLLARPDMARTLPATFQGMSDETLPLLPQLTELRVGFMAGKLPLAVISPHIKQLCMMGRQRLWSHQRGAAVTDDMEAFVDALGMGGIPGVAGPWMQGAPLAQAQGLAAQQNMPAGHVIGPFAGQLLPLAAQNNGHPAGPQGAAAAGGAAAAAAAGQGQGAAGGAPAAPVGGGLNFAAAGAPIFGAPPATLRAQAAAQAAEAMLGLSSLQSLDLNFTQLCAICMTPGGRAVLDNIVELTVLMRGYGSVPGGVPHMPSLKKVCLYDDCNGRIPGRSMVASYDQKEDHQLWRNQSIEELTLSGSFILGGFFDSNALLRAHAQFTKLRLWVFRDCMDLSVGHLAALLAVRVAPVVRLEGATVITHNHVRALVALNPGSKVELQWAAHVPPQVGGPAATREQALGMMGLDVMGPWDADDPDDNEPVPQFDAIGVDQVDALLANGGQLGAADGPGGGAGGGGGAMAAAMFGGAQQQQAGGQGVAGPGVQVAFGAPVILQLPGGVPAGAGIMQQLQALAEAGMPGAAAAVGGGGAIAGAGVAQQLQQMLQQAFGVFPPVGGPGVQVAGLANQAGAAGAGVAAAGAAAAAGVGLDDDVAQEVLWQFNEAVELSDEDMSDDAEAAGWFMG